MKLSGPNPGFKVVLLGNSGAGKTTILQSALNDSPEKVTRNTIGCECHPVPVKISDGTVANLKVWDTAGQEVYRSIVPVYVRDATAALLVYDVTDEASFTSLDQWHSMLMEEQQRVGHVLIYVIGNKIDLKNGQCVADVLAREFAESKRGRHFLVSALEGTGIKELFKVMAEDLVQGKGQDGRMSVLQAPAVKKEGGCC